MINAACSIGVVDKTIEDGICPPLGTNGEVGGTGGHTSVVLLDAVAAKGEATGLRKPPLVTASGFWGLARPDHVGLVLLVL